MHFEFVSGSIYIQNIEMFINEITDIATLYNCTIQALNANKIAGKEHLQMSIKKALRAFKLKRNSANDLGIEIMRYASGKRQIEEAFSMGIKNGKNNVVFAVIGNQQDVSFCMKKLLEIVNEEDLVTYTYQKKAVIIDQFEITSAEITVVGEESIPLLVLERVALVDILK